MGKCIVITSGKGGVGKTSLTANIGAKLAQLGKKVVVVDMNTGLRNLDITMGLESRIICSLVDVIEGRCRIRQAVVKDKTFEGLYLMPTAHARNNISINSEQVKKLCLELKETYDYVIIDCPSGIDQGFENAIACAEEAIIVSTPDIASVRASDRVIGILNSRGIYNCKLIINKFRRDLTELGAELTPYDILELLSIRLLGILLDNDEVRIASNSGNLVANTNSEISQQFEDIAHRILGEEINTEYLYDMINIKKL